MSCCEGRLALHPATRFASGPPLLQGILRQADLPPILSGRGHHYCLPPHSASPSTPFFATPTAALCSTRKAGPCAPHQNETERQQASRCGSTRAPRMGHVRSIAHMLPQIWRCPWSGYVSLRRTVPEHTPHNSPNPTDSPNNVESSTPYQSASGSGPRAPELQTSPPVASPTQNAPMRTAGRTGPSGPTSNSGKGVPHSVGPKQR